MKKLLPLEVCSGDGLVMDVESSQWSGGCV